MKLMINGRERELSQDHLTVAALITELGLGERRVAVEVNETIVRRADYETHPVSDGDQVEIVHFVGGGA